MGGGKNIINNLIIQAKNKYTIVLCNNLSTFQTFFPRSFGTSDAKNVLKKEAFTETFQGSFYINYVIQTFVRKNARRIDEEKRKKKKKFV